MPSSATDLDGRSFGGGDDCGTSSLAPREAPAAPAIAEPDCGECDNNGVVVVVVVVVGGGGGGGGDSDGISVPGAGGGWRGSGE